MDGSFRTNRNESPCARHAREGFSEDIAEGVISHQGMSVRAMPRACKVGTRLTQGDGNKSW